MIVRTSLSVLMLAAALASPVQAQTTSPTAPDTYRDQRALPDPADPNSRDALLKARGEAYHRASDDQQTQEELRTTRALNDEIAAQNAWPTRPTRRPAWTMTPPWPVIRSRSARARNRSAPPQISGAPEQGDQLRAGEPIS